jgi:hypothetical protein
MFCDCVSQIPPPEQHQRTSVTMKAGILKRAMKAVEGADHAPTEHDSDRQRLQGRPEKPAGLGEDSQERALGEQVRVRPVAITPHRRRSRTP